MKWHWVVIVVLITSLIPGCSTGETIHLPDPVDKESDHPIIGDVTVSEGEAESEGHQFEPPFPANDNFFTPPGIEAAPVVADSSSAEHLPHAQIRVIGFSQVGENEPQALVALGDRLETVGTGDSIGDVIIVAVDAPNVIFQQRNERWTVALFKQRRNGIDRLTVTRPPDSPRTKQQSTFAGTGFAGIQSTRADRRVQFGNGSARGAELNQSQAVTGAGLPPMPEEDASGDSFSDLLLPDDLELPDLPLLPEAEISPDDPLPGIDSIPQLPAP